MKFANENTTFEIIDNIILYNGEAFNIDEFTYKYVIKDGVCTIKKGLFSREKLIKQIEA